MLELLPPELEVTPDINLKIRVRVLAQVLFDLTDACGVDCTESIQKGVLDKQIVDRITVSFFDANNVIKGEVIFQIDWDKMEFLAKTNEDVTLLQSIDFTRLVAPQLDQPLYAVLFRHVERLKEVHEIVRVKSYYHYRTKYNVNTNAFTAAMEYMGHSNNYEPPKRDVSAMNYELQAVFQGLDGCLDVLLRT